MKTMIGHPTLLLILPLMRKKKWQRSQCTLTKMKKMKMQLEWRKCHEGWAKCSGQPVEFTKIDWIQHIESQECLTLLDTFDTPFIQHFRLGNQFRVEFHSYFQILGIQYDWNWKTLILQNESGPIKSFAERTLERINCIGHGRHRETRIGEWQWKLQRRGKGGRGIKQTDSNARGIRNFPMNICGEQIFSDIVQNFEK